MPILKRNDLIRSFQRVIIQQMTQSFQWGTITIPSYKGRLQDSLDEAQLLIDETRRVINALDALKDPEPTEEQNADSAGTGLGPKPPNAKGDGGSGQGNHPQCQDQGG